MALPRRALTPGLMQQLGEGGLLSPLLERVRRDRTLCLELRGGYLNVYYRGGNLLKVSEAGAGVAVEFDTNYLRGAPLELPARAVKDEASLGAWLGTVPHLKQAMDLFMGTSAKDEREFQQLIVRDNNFGSIARRTDVYICDIEYAAKQGRFDMVGVHWPSIAAVRKRAEGRRLVLAEVKHGDDALTGNAGLHAHVRDLNEFLASADNVRELKDDMVQVFNQKRALGLMDCGKDLVSFSEEPPLYLLLLANHDPESATLDRELDSMPPSPHAEVRVMRASMLGYGLYDDA